MHMGGRGSWGAVVVDDDADDDDDDDDDAADVDDMTMMIHS